MTVTIRSRHNKNKKIVITGTTDTTPEICRQCPYKQFAEKMINQQTPSVLQPVVDTGTSTESGDIVLQAKKEGLFTRFQKYVAKNREANRKAGDTPLMEDLVKWGGNLAAGAAALGQEEVDGLERKKKINMSRREREQHDEETLDFLMGKKTKK